MLIHILLLTITTLIVVNISTWTYFANRHLFLSWSNLFIDVLNTPGYTSANSDLVYYRNLP